MTKIVILGAGYGGLVAAVTLGKKFRGNKNICITLVDQKAYQGLSFNLYEVATAEEEFTSIKQLKKAITLPLKNILKKTNVQFVQAEILEVNQQQQFVQTQRQKLEYNYLISALGSESDFFNIEGAKQYGLPLKNLKEALFIRNQIEFALQAHRLDMNKKNIRVAVAGGGYTGVEFAAELANMMKILAWKNNYPKEKIEITIIEATNELIPGLSKRLSKDAWERLKILGVRVQLSSRITKVTANFVEFLSGEKMEYDVLVWTAGVKARELKFTKPVAADRKGRSNTTEFLQLTDFHNIFMLGDQACIMNCGKPAPATAQDAIDQAEYLAKALPILMQNKKPAPYHGLKHGFIVTMGGRWAILDYNGIYIKGPLAYLIREFAHIRYLRKIVGLWKAIALVIFQVEIFGRND